MQQLKEHKLFKIASLVLTLTILTPALVKLAHAFENHHHNTCTNTQTTHFHEFNLDCDFYKFKLQTQTFAEILELDYCQYSIPKEKPKSAYASIINTSLRHSFLRGPPLHT